MTWEKVNGALPAGDFVKMIKLRRKKICLVRNNGRFFAFQNTCPHAGGILSSGWCSHGHLICPIHRYEYSLETGRGAEGQGDYISKYETSVREDGLYIGLKESWWKNIWS